MFTSIVGVHTDQLTTFLSKLTPLLLFIDLCSLMDIGIFRTDWHCGDAITALG